MKRIAILAAVVVSIAAALGQSYHPRSGETVLELEIKGRGNVFIHLFVHDAPRTTHHIIELVKSGFYDSLRFHRAIRTPKPYLVQVGDPATRTGDMDDPKIGSGGSGKPIPYEASDEPNLRGYVGLARITAAENSGDSQFYILLSPARFLDGHYTVFGKVVEGMNVVDEIQLGDRITKALIIHGS